MTLKFVTRDEYLESHIEALEDIARLKKRVTELESNQETIIKFLMARFSQKCGQIKRLLKVKEPKKERLTVFGKALTGDITTEKAIIQMMSAKPVSVDPIVTHYKENTNLKVKDQPVLADCLRR